jgi:hypothetical protein
MFSALKDTFPMSLSFPQFLMPLPTRFYNTNFLHINSFSPPTPNQEAILTRTRSAFDGVMQDTIPSPDSPATLPHVTSMSSLSQKFICPKQLPSPLGFGAPSQEERTVPVDDLLSLLQLGASPIERRLPRAASLLEKEELEPATYLHNVEMRYRSHLLAPRYPAVNPVHGQEPFLIPVMSAQREAIRSMMSLESFLHRDVGVYMKDLLGAIRSLPATLEQDRLRAHYKKLDSSFRSFLGLLEQRLAKESTEEHRQLLFQFAFSPKQVSDLLMRLIVFVQAKRFDVRFWQEIEQKFLEANERFRMAGKWLQDEPNEEFWKLCRSSDYYNYIARLGSLERACKNKKEKEALQDDAKGTLHITHNTNTDFWFDHARACYIIGGKKFGLNQNHIAETQIAMENLIAECLETNAELRGDRRAIVTIRYQIETFFNQLSLMVICAKSSVRYGEDIHFDPYTLEKINEKKVPEPTAEDMQKLSCRYGMAHLPNTATLRMVLTAYFVLSYKREMELEAARQFLGYSGSEVMIDIDFSQVTKKDLLLSPGCGLVQETIAGFREKFQDLTV